MEGRLTAKGVSGEWAVPCSHLFLTLNSLQFLLLQCYGMYPSSYIHTSQSYMTTSIARFLFFRNFSGLGGPLNSLTWTKPYYANGRTIFLHFQYYAM